MAEIIKHAVIAGIDLFDYLENNYENAITLDDDTVEKLVYDSIVIKSTIVNRDETEKGERRLLNFGHTIGHAIEKCTDFNHGEAVSVGMVAASDLSVEKGLLASAEVQRLKLLLQQFRLPTKVNVSSDAVLDAIDKDKKREGDKVHFVFLKELGNAVVKEIAIGELKKFAGKWMLASN